MLFSCKPRSFIDYRKVIVGLSACWWQRQSLTQLYPALVSVCEDGLFKTHKLEKGDEISIQRFVAEWLPLAVAVGNRLRLPLALS